MTNKHSVDRRQFLSKLSATVTGTAAVVAASSSLAQATISETLPVVETHSTSKDKGYQRTQHIETYYQLADF